MPPRRNRVRGKFSRIVPTQNGREQCQTIACRAQLDRRAPQPPPSQHQCTSCVVRDLLP